MAKSSWISASLSSTQATISTRSRNPVKQGLNKLKVKINDRRAKKAVGKNTVNVKGNDDIVTAGKKNDIRISFARRNGGKLGAARAAPTFEELTTRATSGVTLYKEGLEKAISQTDRDFKGLSKTNRADADMHLAAETIVGTLLTAMDNAKVKYPSSLINALIKASAKEHKVELPKEFKQQMFVMLAEHDEKAAKKSAKNEALRLAEISKHDAQRKEIINAADNIVNTLLGRSDLRDALTPGAVGALFIAINEFDPGTNQVEAATQALDGALDRRGRDSFPIRSKAVGLLQDYTRPDQIIYLDTDHLLGEDLDAKRAALAQQKAEAEAKAQQEEDDILTFDDVVDQTLEGLNQAFEDVSKTIGDFKAGVLETFGFTERDGGAVSTLR